MRRAALVLLLAICSATVSAAAAPAWFDWFQFAGDYQRAMATEAAGAWRQVPCQPDAVTAAAESRRTGKPLFVFVYVTLACGDVCPGGRATRGTSFADPAVIARLRRDFVCLAVDAKRDGFPVGMAGLDLCERIYRGYPARDRGFSCSCVLTADGAHLLGTSGIGTVATYRASICYDAAKFARFLGESAERGARWRTADAAGRRSLEAEIWKSVVATTSPSGFVTGR